MRKLLLALVLVLSIGANAQYRYKNIEVTATSKDGVVKSDENGFYLTCDSVSYHISMYKYNATNIWITNHSSEPIIVRWKNIWVSNDKDFISEVNPYYSDIDDIRTGEQKIYPRGLNTFWLGYGKLLSKKKKTAARILITLIQKGKVKRISIELDSNPIK